MRSVLAFVTTLMATPIAAQVALPCDWQARADAIVSPWEEKNSATFANGDVRVALIDVAEPAGASFYLHITHPPYDSLGLRTCTVVGLGENIGYAAIFFDELEAGYDPAGDFKFEVPAIIYLPEHNFQNSALLSITVNQALGEVIVKQRLAE